MLTLALTLALHAAPCAPLPARTPAPTLSPATLQQEKQAEPVYDPAADGRQQIAAALALAKRENKRVLVQWGANWCGWCLKLHALLTSDPAVRKKLLYEYEVVYVDIGDWKKHMDLAQGYGAELKENGVPFWTILDGDGKLVANEATGPLEREGAHDPAKVLEVLTRHQAAYPQARAVLDAALASAREHDRRLWVSFGAPWCGWCHRLEDWVHSEAAAPLIARDFDFLKLDVDRTIGAQAILERYRGAESGGIPWWVFLDAQGTALADSGQGGQNLGCPWSDEELEQFRGILGKVCRQLDGDAIARLVDSLRAVRVRTEEASRKAKQE